MRANSMSHETWACPFQDLPTAKEKVKELTKEGKAFFCWKLVNLSHTAVEKSQGFENLVAMYVNLGNKALTRFSDAKCNPEQELEYIRHFTEHVRKMGLPLVPGNYQDAWYNKYEKTLLNLYEKYLLDDWQSFYVLLTLLKRSKDIELRQRAQ